MVSRVFSVRMGRATDLSEFAKGQIVLALRLGASLTRRVGCSCASVLSKYQNWCTSGQTINHKYDKSPAAITVVTKAVCHSTQFLAAAYVADDPAESSGGAGVLLAMFLGTL